MTPIYRGSRPDLAQAHLEPFCLVLSGSGSDVAVGLSRIKEQSGITLAQVTEDAEFDGMPRAALETGMVDLALPDGDTAEAEAPAGLL